MSLTGKVESNYTLRGTMNMLEKLQGYSAYEIAVINGFEGTEKEWLESLRGDGTVINDLTTGGTTDALSAEMGKVLASRTDRNILDNSDFTDPVNRKGEALYPSGTGTAGDTVDRWRKSAPLQVEVADGLVTVTNHGTGSNGFSQFIPKGEGIKAGESYTLVCETSDGIIHVGEVTVGKSGEGYERACYIADEKGASLRLYQPSQNYPGGLFTIMLASNRSVSIRRLGLYAGSYTQDTLPPYQPKGYATEYAVCCQYDQASEKYIGLTSGAIGAASEQMLNGVRRKVAALAGFADGINRRMRNDDCYFGEVSSSEKSFTIMCGGRDTERYCSIGRVADSVNLYELVGLQGYSLSRATLYSTKGATKTFVGLWLDGVRYDEFSALEDSDLRYSNAMWIYTVTESNYTVTVCVRLCADYIQITESAPEQSDQLVKGCISSFSALGAASARFKAFTVADSTKDSKYFVETVEDLGDAVIKTIHFK